MAVRRGKVYADLEHYYNDVPAARHSGESDYGVWWKDGTGANWRVSWVHDTGDIYAVRLGRTQIVENEHLIRISTGDDEGPLILLGKLDISQGLKPTDKHVDNVLLKGWAEMCGQPESLSWIAGRIPAPQEEPTDATD